MTVRLKQYPRPQLRRLNDLYEILNGEWDYGAEVESFGAKAVFKVHRRGVKTEGNIAFLKNLYIMKK